MATVKYKALLLALLSQAASADFYEGLYVKKQKTETSSCIGVCSFTIDDAETNRIGAIGGYYAISPIADIGTEIRIDKDVSLQLNLRKRFGPYSASIGYGLLHHDVTLTRAADQLFLIDKNNPFYSVNIDRSIYDTAQSVGRIGISYNVSNSPGSFEGRAQVGTDSLGNPIFGVIELTNAKIKSIYWMIYYTHSLK